MYTTVSGSKLFCIEHELGLGNREWGKWGPLILPRLMQFGGFAPGKIASMGGVGYKFSTGMNPRAGSLGCPKTHTTQFVSESHSSHDIPGQVAAKETLCNGPAKGHLGP